MQVTLQHCSEPLKLWEKIEIIVGEGSSAGHYKARFDDFVSEGIVVSIPEFTHGDTLLHENSECVVLLTREDAVYQFNSRIQMVRTDSRKYYLLEPPRNVKRVQRRQFVRIELLRKINYAIVTPGQDNDYDNDGKIIWHKATTVNVSGGGVLLNTNREIPVGALLLMNLRFFGEIGLPLAMIGIVRRQAYSEKLDIQFGVEFLGVEQLSKYFTAEEIEILPESVTYFDTIMQGKLVNWVFNQQVEYRQKGLL